MNLYIKRKIKKKIVIFKRKKIKMKIQRKN